jgi:hypothetical protein
MEAEQVTYTLDLLVAVGLEAVQLIFDKAEMILYPELL